MSETTNKLAIQHEVIGIKTDCKYFSNIGNLCSRVQNGMMRCDEYLECEFKYIDALKEENKNLKQQFEIDKNQINYFIEENEKQKEQIKQLEDFIKSDGEIDHINHEYTYKLKKENEKLKKILQELKDLSLKTYDVADFQMYFDNLRGNNK